MLKTILKVLNSSSFPWNGNENLGEGITLTKEIGLDIKKFKKLKMSFSQLARVGVNYKDNRKTQSNSSNSR